ncbi:hypothetical protein FHETE_3036 [Fusarium heterosporum]|uniref:C2H2-type domain-containing protein n=1 Tax=Fusarium heterosporum TaxID=42747 RepID=A0A8H5TRK1_FUSHE|nr:hypothetical protein FHETE_3036 [Fusarium heterosporum]
MQSGTLFDGTFWCEPCNRTFKTWELLHNHKGKMSDAGKKDHIHCKICSANFETQEAHAIHLQREHPQAQNLHCPACKKGPFARVGGLMSHVQNECPSLSSRVIEDLRKQKSEFSHSLQLATNQPTKSDFKNYMPPANTTSDIWNVQGETSPFLLEQKQFPQLDAPGSDTQQRNKENIKGNEWNKGKNLFPSAPVAQRPTQQQLQNATAPNARAAYDLLSTHNPNHPNFNVGRYYCTFTDKFNCPVGRCGKTFKSGSGLLAHLNSEAHSETKYRCPYCLNTFGSLLSITQHAESSGNRCRIRETDAYKPYMNQLLAGMVDVAEEGHEDGTPKFEMSKDFKPHGQEPKVNPKTTGENPFGDIEW